MAKKKPRQGYHFEMCPICGYKYFEYYSASMWGFGKVEQSGFCDRCGYRVEQAYSDVYTAFWDITKGFKDYYGKYHPKNVKRHRRIRRKLKIKHIEVNPIWLNYI